ncbi:MAG: oxidoreductase [Planctomycetes bacterium]|nr:oxidoreductase [Planctomycetota bacterium]
MGKDNTTCAASASPYVPMTGKIVAAEKMTDTERFFRIVLDGGRQLGHKAGQFVEVSVFGIGEAPISICSSPTQVDSFELCVRSAGNVTRALHAMKAGDTVGIRGPFGNCFDTEKAKGQDVLFVAGGLGLAPARPFIRYVLEHRKDYGKVSILVGAKTQAELLFKSELKEWEARPDVECLVTVDRATDGWAGRVGLITTLFGEVTLSPMNTVAVVIGPPIMFKFAVLEALSAGVPEHRIVCSLERKMKCGLGKCGHCQIRHVYVCQDGPVFTYDQLRKLREGI